MSSRKPLPLFSNDSQLSRFRHLPTGLFACALGFATGACASGGQGECPDSFTLATWGGSRSQQGVDTQKTCGMHALVNECGGEWMSSRGVWV